MNNICYHTPNLEVHVVIDLDWFKLWIVRHEVQVTPLFLDAFHGEFTIDDAQYNALIPRCFGTGHNQKVAITNAGTFHGVAFHPHVERGCGMLDKEFVEIDGQIEIIVCR